MKMKSKTVIITGGGKGIGFGVATAFAKEGADIVITGRQESALAAAKEKLESAYGIRVGYVAGDLGQEETAPKVVAKAIEMTGRLDVLINNAQASKSGVSSALYKTASSAAAPRAADGFAVRVLSFDRAGTADANPPPSLAYIRYR